MPVILIELKTESPVILSSRAGKQGFSTLHEWIPGSTLRGALLSGAVDFGYEEDKRAADEASKPECVVHPAYPTLNGRVSRPATPFVYRCKAEDRLVDILGSDGISELTRANTVREMIAPILDGGPEPLCRVMRNVPGATKPATGRPVLPWEDGSVELVRVKTDIFTSVGINKRRRAAEKGMLHTYEAILPGQTFRFLAICRDSVRDFIKGEGTLFLGRGISRGFGRCSAKLIKEWDQDAALSRLSGAAQNWIERVNGLSRVAVYARSPATRLKGWGVSSPVPEDADLKRLPVDVPVEMRVARAGGGEPLQIGGTTIFRSFSSVTGLPRPELTCSERGSILILESPGPEDLMAEALGASSLLGWDSLAHLGLNIMYPLGWWYDDPIHD